MAGQLGRRPPHPESTAPRLRLSQFLRATRLPVIPPVIDWVGRVDRWPVYRNDEIGDCTVAAAGHMVEAWTAYAGTVTSVISDDDVLRAYTDVSGYVPGRSDTDRGAVMQDVLSYWRRTGIGDHKIIAFAQVNQLSLAEVADALNLFGHVYVGFNCPESALSQFDAGQPWTVVENSPDAGGHAVNLGYWNRTAGEMLVVTWGAIQRMTVPFWLRYVEEAWVAISPEWFGAAGLTPSGVDTSALGAAFAQLTGEPSPFPVAGPDERFAAVLRPWVTHRHVGTNAVLQRAALAWLAEKGLTR